MSTHHSSLPIWERVLTAIPKAAIRGIDAVVRRVTGVYEFSDAEWCLLRVATVKSPANVTLSDGTVIAKGEIVGELHLWNEHIPSMPRSGPDLAWGLRAYSLLVRSFRLLAQHSARDPRLHGVRAWHGKSSFLPKGVAAPDMLTRLGFDVVRDSKTASFPRRFADFWDNFYWWMLAWTFNPASLKRKDFFKLERWDVWISAAKLREKYRR